MYTLNGWWFLSSGGSYPPVFTVDTGKYNIIGDKRLYTGLVGTSGIENQCWFLPSGFLVSRLPVVARY